MERVLVAGATGYLGGYVARELKRRGHFVRALARHPERLESLKDVLDETRKGEVTDPRTLEGCCDGIDVVFSSVGITKQKGRQTFRDVDYQGNRNLLEAATRAGVGKFVYVSVFNGPKLRHLEIVRAHEDFVDVLAASGLRYAVLRPTGYFSDLTEVLTMARKGRVFLFGDGHNKINPIHGADLAVACCDAIRGGPQEPDVGGPEVLSWREIAALAFEALGRPAKIVALPAGPTRLLAALARTFAGHQGEVLAFLTTMATSDVVAPKTGAHTLGEHYRSLVSAG